MPVRVYAMLDSFSSFSISIYIYMVWMCWIIFPTETGVSIGKMIASVILNISELIASSLV